MAPYRYRAIDSDGNPITGTMDESSAFRVTALLHERGYQVSSVELEQKPSWIPPLRPRLTWAELRLFTDELHRAAKSGLPLPPALRSLAAELRSRRVKNALDGVAQELERGKTLAEAITLLGADLPPVFVSAIRAGEVSGNLPAILAHLTDYSASMAETRSGLQEAIIYPMLVLVCCILTALHLILNVLPPYVDMYTGMGALLPAPTRMLSALHYGVHTIRYALVPVLIALPFALYALGMRVTSTRRVSYIGDALRTRAPVYGRLFRGVTLARFARVLGLLLSSRVPAPDSLTLAGAASGNTLLARGAEQARVYVERGGTIAEALTPTGYFPEAFCWSVRVAEQRGDLDEALAQLAETYERTVSRSGRMIMAWLTPALIVLLGMFISFLLLAMYMPLFSLADQISGG